MSQPNHSIFDIANDDTVVCRLFSILPITDTTDWEELCSKINEVIDQFSKSYIWHRDQFRFSIPLLENNIKGSPTHLVAYTCFGDNIEDEWFIVYIVYEITKLFENVIIQVGDSDGEFLLIEAADYLPSWANPESTKNRVFVYKNHLHLIPKSIKSNTNLSVEEAIDIIKSNYHKTLASSEIQNAIKNRISGYPGKIADTIHRAIVTLPLDIAAFLALKPSLIAPIVTTYCNHDRIDAKLCKNVDFQNCVDVQVRFTKCTYAMLMHSKLIHSMKKINISENDKKSFLGFKLTCGYYMIMNRSKDLFSSKEFNKFFNSLKVNGYFKDNIEGSKDYNRLLENAKQYFLNMECPVSSYVANSITNIMSTKEFSKLKETMKQDTDMEMSEDDDDWLNIHPDQLNDLLHTRYGKKGKFKNNDMITPHSISSKLSDFLKQTSDFEGIEQSENKEETEIHFEPDEFVTSLEKMLNVLSYGGKIDEGSESDDDLDMSDDDVSQEIKEVLEQKILNPDDSKKNVILENIVKSMKEEQGSTGPSSNILRTIGIDKSYVLDSDDDDDE